MPLEYFILKPDGEQTGTFSLEQIKAMISSGFIDGETRYWHEGITIWKSVESIDESLAFDKPDTATRSLVPPSVRPLPGIQRPGATSRNWRKPTSTAVAPKRNEIAPPVIPTESQRIAKTTPGAPEADPMTMPAPQVPLASLSMPPVTEKAPVKLGGPVIETLPMPPMPTEPPKRRRLWVYVLLAVVLALGALTFFFVHRMGPTSSRVAPSNKVTLTDKHVFVLTNQAAIKKYDEALRDTSVIDSLNDKIAHTTNQATITMLKLGIEKEKARHAETVQAQFVASQDAERIDPGTYTVLAYFDHDGILIDPRPGDTWVGITVNGQPVYAYIAPAAPSGQ